jgi:hypothetical protein
MSAPVLTCDACGDSPAAFAPGGGQLPLCDACLAELDAVLEAFAAELRAMRLADVDHDSAA